MLQLGASATFGAMHLRSVAQALALAAPLLLSGCLYTVQRFDDGTVLPPGVTDLSLGIGKTSSWSASCPEWGNVQSSGEHKGECAVYTNSVDADGNWQSGTQTFVKPILTKQEANQYHASWRLGVRKEWGPFKGVELGWNLDAPTEPATLEFWGKLGLPGFADTNTAHSLTAGWGIGSWSDNSWWLQYSLSHGFGPLRPWLGSRVLRQATRMDEVTSGVGEKLVSKPRWIGQAFGGASVKMPKAIVLPDWLALEGTWTLSGAAAGLTTRAQENEVASKGNFGIHLGMGWSFAP